MVNRGAADENGQTLIPPLVAEDHVCPQCRLSYLGTSVESAVEAIRSLPAAVHAAVSAVPTEALRVRPTIDRWSVTEYLCHLRDVYVTYTIRLHRARTEDGPVLEPMFNELRARRFRYNQSHAELVLDELAAAVAGFCDEVSRTRPAEWERVVTRLPAEQRTARWLVRQAMHEGLHHLDDIRRTAEAAVWPA
jgi:hypothetical protein